MVPCSRQALRTCLLIWVLINIKQPQTRGFTGDKKETWALESGSPSGLCLWLCLVCCVTLSKHWACLSLDFLMHGYVDISPAASGHLPLGSFSNHSFFFLLVPSWRNAKQPSTRGWEAKSSRHWWYGSWIMAPPKCPVLIPRTCEYITLHGQRDFAEVIMLKILK